MPLLLEMYLPSGLSLLQSLQLPLSLFTGNSDQSTLHYGDFHGREELNSLGNISPYHDAPAVPGVSPDLPGDCTVDQVILVSFQPGNHCESVP